MVTQGNLMTEETSDLAEPGHVERDTDRLRIGDTIDRRYTVEGVLGSGGMGTVYRARDAQLGRTVALKLIHPDLLAKPELRAAFYAEARAMARVQHPNVVAIHNIVEVRAQPYIVMEHVPGADLRRWSRTRGLIGSRDAVDILTHVSRGLQAIHDAGTLHRDVKAANVLIGDDGRVALTDLGLSSSFHDLAADASSVFGTPSNVAPELARSEGIEPSLATRIDVYALGVLAYELLAGRKPFKARSLEALLLEHAYGEVPPPSTVRPGLPTVFDRVLLRALAKDPATRTPTPRELARELREAQRSAEEFPGGLRILTVDDEPGSLLGVRELLLDAFPGADVLSVTSPRTAEQMALTEPPDIVITDLHMPEGGGAQLCASLRSRPQTAATPIVVLTGHGGAPDWHQLRPLGVDRFLLKPIDFETLESTIRTLLRPGREASAGRPSAADPVPWPKRRAPPSAGPEG